MSKLKIEIGNNESVVKVRLMESNSRRNEELPVGKIRVNFPLRRTLFVSFPYVALLSVFGFLILFGFWAWSFEKNKSNNRQYARELSQMWTVLAAEGFDDEATVVRFSKRILELEDADKTNAEEIRRIKDRLTDLGFLEGN
ncbi:MAG: hypothetical protein AAFN77_19165 [Planctomycetota bacterium]